MIEAVAPEPVYFYLVPWQRDLFPTVSHVCVPTHLAPGVPYLLPSRFGKGQRADEDAELFAGAPVPVARGLGCNVYIRGNYECENETTNPPCVCGFVCCDECGDAGRSRCWCTEDDDYR